jgi:hypothetical protein
MKRLNTIEKSRGKPNFLKDSATSCIELQDDKSTTHVKLTTSRESNNIINITPWDVTCMPKGNVYIIVPACTNGCKTAIEAPNGIINSIFKAEVLIERFEIKIKVTR